MECLNIERRKENKVTEGVMEKRKGWRTEMREKWFTVELHLLFHR